MGIQINGQTDIVTSTTPGGSVTVTPASFPSVRSINATGISTFSAGPVLIGSGTSTGTASQPFQVTGGAYVSGSLGIGITVPNSTLDTNATSNDSSIIEVARFTAGNVTGSTSLRIFSGQSNINTSLRRVVIDSYRSDTNTTPIHFTQTTSNGTSTPMVINSAGNVGIGSTIPQVKLDVNGTISATQFNLPNNYALVAYSEGSSQTSRTTTSTTYIDDEDNGTVRASFTYKRGDIIVFEAFIPGGVALSDTDVANYAGLQFVLRASNGTTTTDSSETRVWYRDDNRGVRETMQLSTTTLIINAASTTFNDNDTVFAYIRYARLTGLAGSISNTGMCQWSGRRFVRGYQFRKVA
jgi:hypothetical protein